MKDKTNLIRVFTGTDVVVSLLKEELESAGISSIIKNEYSSGLSAGFMGGVPSSIDLFIQELDMEKAESIITEFAKINEG